VDAQFVRARAAVLEENQDSNVRGGCVAERAISDRAQGGVVQTRGGVCTECVKSLGFAAFG